MQDDEAAEVSTPPLGRRGWVVMAVVLGAVLVLGAPLAFCAYLDHVLVSS